MRQNALIFTLIAAMKFLTHTITIAAIALTFPLPIAAQAPGVAIEVQSNRKQDAAIIEKAKALKDAGKLKLTMELAKEQLKTPAPQPVVFPMPRAQALSGREVAKIAKEGHLQLGWFYLCTRCEKWHVNLAGAYAVAADAIATCQHCVVPKSDMREGYLIAVDHTGEVVPVISILAADRVTDGAILRVSGGKFTPLAFNDNVSPGDPAFCYSAPLGQSGYFSDGIVNRFFWNGIPGKEGSENRWKNLRVNVSTDWAPGSSGAAVLDQAGNVIGHVSTIQPMTEGPRQAPATPPVTPPAEAEKKDEKKDEKKKPAKVDRFGGATLITLHDASSARAMMELAKPLRDLKPGETIALQKALDKAHEKAVEKVPEKVAEIAPEKAPEKKADNEPGVLKVGSAAPALQTGKWLQGEEVKGFEKGKTYIVEFWATWCGPCRATIPHLNELHKQFADKGLVVIGQNCWERDTEKVAPFIKQMGDKMTYRVALDAVEGNDPNTGAMATKWMKAAGQRGIPAAFVVDKEGVVAWIGHPAQLKSEMVEEILAGKFAPVKMKAASDDGAKLRDAMMKHGAKAARALKDKDWDAAQNAVAEFAEALPASKKFFADAMLFKIALAKKDTAAANEAAGKIAAATEVESAMLNEIAWELITTKDLEKPDLVIAEKLARRSVESATEKSKASVMDTLARVVFLGGRKEDAIKIQESAINAATEDEAKAKLTKTVEAYRRGEIPAAE